MHFAQRVWNLQPLGGLAGDGISPFKIIRFIFTSGSGTGTAEKSACVYGWRGLSNISSVSPSSIVFPKYITKIWSVIYFTTDKSCEINTYVKPSFNCNSFNKFIIWAWIDTSSALTGSSQITNFGFTARALAIQILWRCPPENSWG